MFSRSHLTVVDLFFARTAARWGAVSGRLLTSLAGAFADVFCEINDLATLRGAVATVGMYRARAAVTPFWPWAFVMVAPASGRGYDDQRGRLRLLVAAALLFLSAIPGMAPEPPVWVVPVCGVECHARPSAALAHLSTRAKSVGTVSTSCVASFSNIFLSRTPCRKAVMMEASEIRGVVPRTLVKREMNFWRVSPGSCLTAWRWASTPCC
jgi:hypothetical protein